MNPRLQRKRQQRSPRQGTRHRWSRLAILGALLLTGLLWASARFLPALATAQQGDLSQLPITFPVQSPEVAAYFGEMARPEDIASVPPTHLFLLSQSTSGQKMVGFRSWTEAQSQLDALTSPVDVVMYNPEHWEFTPDDEQQDLAATVKQFADFSHARDLQFMFAPDRRFAEAYLAQVAPDVDAVLLQGQRLQHDPQTFSTWVLGMTEVARAANPDIQVFVQVGATLGTASEMYAALETVAGDIDGIAVWSMPRSLPVLQEFVTLVRDSPPLPTAAPSATPTSVPSAPVPTESPSALPPSATPAATQGAVPTPTGQSTASAAVPEPQASEVLPSPVPLATATPLPGSGSAAPGMGWVTDLLLFAGGAGFGLVIGFILGWSLRRGS